MTDSVSSLPQPHQSTEPVSMHVYISEFAAINAGAMSPFGDDIEFPFKSYVQFRNAVGYRPSPNCVLMQHRDGNVPEFSWVELS